MTKNVFIYIFILIECIIFSIALNVNFTTTNQSIKKEETFIEKNEYIKGCPNINSFNNSVENLTHTQLLKISCLCSGSDNELGVSINCIYGSTLQDLKRVLKLAKKDNINVHKVIFKN